MDPNFFFSSHSSDDSLLSPLYEVMFPFIPAGSFTSFLTSDHHEGFTSTARQKPAPDDASSMAFPPFPGSCLHLPSSAMPNLYDPELGLRSSGSRPFTPYLVDPNPLDLPDSTSEHAKHRYSCEACQVGFCTSQALGAHMSSHSKERKGTTVATAKPNAASSASKTSKKKKTKKKKSSLSPISKKIEKGKAAVKRVPETSSTIKLVAKKNSSPELPIESRSATRAAAAANPPEEMDSLSYMIDAIWLTDVCDMDFSSLF